MISNTKLFSSVPLAPLNDQIIKVNEAFSRDSRVEKLNLGIGVYKLEGGALPIFESVRRAELSVIEAERTDGAGKGYAPIEGFANFCLTSGQLIFGSELFKQGNIANLQTIGGSGALNLAAMFARRHMLCKEIHLTQPCWANHPGIFDLQAYKIESLAYYDKASCKLDVSALLHGLKQLPAGSLFLIQGCCHNPSGLDLPNEHWEELLQICQRRELLPIIDLAYQGLAQSLDEDAFPARLFAQRGQPCFVAHSFSKSLSLYGERIGSLSVVTDSPASAKAVLSQLKNLVRPLYSNPPIHGAKIAAEVLASIELCAIWQDELRTLRQRIAELRAAFVSALQQAGYSNDLSYISQGRGMFCLLDLSPQQVAEMAERFAIYIIPDGRTCIPALSLQNLNRVAQAVQSVRT